MIDDKKEARVAELKALTRTLTVEEKAELVKLEAEIKDEEVK